MNLKSNSNFLPALNTNGSTPRNILGSPTTNKIDGDNNIKLENRVYYMEKAVARLIHAFESIQARLNKIDGDNNNNAINIGALSKTIKGINDGNKDFIQKQHIVTEKLVSDIHKQQHSLQQSTSFINKEISDIRDSMQILSTNLQKNFNVSIKAAISQCNELNVQNSNSITSLRKITDQKVSHLQQLIVDSQKRAQSQNTSILDIINSNQKNQTEFQASFKLFFEKFRDSMHNNLNALQESTQEQISYLDKVLRAEVKTRMKNTQNVNKEFQDKLFQIQETINQNKRDNKRTEEGINKHLESIKEQLQHQQSSNQPLHKMITNLTKQSDEMSQQHLTDIKSIMQLNQDTSEKQFNQIKSLQIQIQQIWARVSSQEKGQQHTTPISPNQFNITHITQQHEQYKIQRPSSYKSDMSSTAAFNAIKHHLSTMPGKPDSIQQNLNDYIQDVDDNNPINSSPTPSRPERMPYADNSNNQSEQVQDEKKMESGQFQVYIGDNQDAENYDQDNYEQQYDQDVNAEIEIEDNQRDNNDQLLDKEETDDMLTNHNNDNDNNDNDNNDNDEEENEQFQSKQTQQHENENVEETEYDMDDIDDILGDDANNTVNDNINEQQQEEQQATEENDDYSEEYHDDDHHNSEEFDNNNDNYSEKALEENKEKGKEEDDDIESTEKALEALEQEQSELNEDNHSSDKDDISKPADDNYSEF